MPVTTKAQRGAEGGESVNGVKHQMGPNRQQNAKECENAR